MTETGLEEPDHYEMRISRLTVDKLGVKLYDKASAVVAELVANGYDADAETVLVELPLGTELATRADNVVVDRGFTVTLSDDGHGMTPAEAQAFFLEVGADRRHRPLHGARSRVKDRFVMGRKGIGKLAPFGICKTMEVRSAGGDKTDRGFRVSHFVLRYDKLVGPESGPAEVEAGPDDKAWDATSGTTITLSDFLPKRVPDRATFTRQLARRFALAQQDFEITIYDTRADDTFAIPHFQVDTVLATRIDVSQTPVPCHGRELAVEGWMAFGKTAIKNEEEAGVRIYARGKIVATTRDFEQPAGFTGEFTARSYLVGEIHAEWLDLDDDDDLVRTDRQGILWDSEYGDALRRWGAERVKQIAKASAGPRRDSKMAIYLRNSNLEARAKAKYPENPTVVEAVMNFGRKIGGLAHEDELNDTDYVDSLTDIVLQVGPHQALISTFQAISNLEQPSVDELLPLFDHTRTAELASYAQIADERVKSVIELREAINRPGVDEGQLQNIIAGAPWLVRSDWSVITQNQSLKTFAREFAVFWADRYGESIEVAINHLTKRPDFTLVQLGLKLHVVEIKKPGHQFDATDYERMSRYLDAFESFMREHQDVARAFSEGFVVDLVADHVNITEGPSRRAYEGDVSLKRVVRRTWRDFLASAELAHELFLQTYDSAQEERAAAIAAARDGDD